MSMDDLLNDIALVDAVTRRFESLGYNMDDAVKAASIAILSGDVIVVTQTDAPPSDDEIPFLSETPTDNSNPRF
jgi:hypothetical protein